MRAENLLLSAQDCPATCVATCIIIAFLMDVLAQFSRRHPSVTMSRRGRGALEVRESHDPFFETTNSLYGISHRKKHYNAPETYRLQYEEPGLTTHRHFPFLYKKASSEIGKGIKTTANKLSKELDYHENAAAVARERAQGLRPIFVKADSPEWLACIDQPTERYVIDPNAYIAAYQHRPHMENPLYTTSNNDIGIKVPSLATVVTERRSRAQAFSNSFNNVQYQDQGLNCAISRSKIHKELDPHFL